MEMKRIEADTLEEAYSKAAKALACSVTEINYEIIQYPTSGVMGLFKKTAIIIAVKKIAEVKTEPTEEKTAEVVIEEKEEKAEKVEQAEKKVSVTEAVEEPITHKVENIENLVPKNDAIVDNFFNDDVKETIEVKKAEPKIEPIETKDTNL